MNKLDVPNIYSSFTSNRDISWSRRTVVTKWRASAPGVAISYLTLNQEGVGVPSVETSYKSPNSAFLLPTRGKLSFPLVPCGSLAVAAPGPFSAFPPSFLLTPGTLDLDQNPPLFNQSIARVPLTWWAYFISRASLEFISQILGP